MWNNLSATNPGILQYVHIYKYRSFWFAALYWLDVLESLDRHFGMTYLIGTLKFELLRVQTGESYQSTVSHLMIHNPRILLSDLSLKGLSPDAVPSLMVCIRSPGLDMDGDRDIAHVSHRTCFSGSAYVVWYISLCFTLNIQCGHIYVYIIHLQSIHYTLYVYIEH